MELKKGYKQTEVGVIPEDWDVIKIGDSLKFKNGLNKESIYFGYGTPIVNYMDVFRNHGMQKSDIHGKVSLTLKEIQSFSAKKGDVFFTRTSETQEEIGISAILLEEIENCVFSGFLLRGRPYNDIVLNEYYQYCLQPSYVRQQIISKSSYTTRALTNGRYLSDVRIVIPNNKSEQTAIAEALSDADALIQSTEKLIAKKRLVKQAAMQQLLSPKEGWEVKRLGDVAEMSSGGTPLTTNNSYYDGDIPWVVIADITKAGKYIQDTDKKITTSGLNNSSAKLYDKGVILFAMYASIGKVTITLIAASCNQAILAIIPKNIDTEYLYYFLSFNESTYSKLGQTGTQSNLSKEIVQNIVLPIPPREEQTRIATILSDMDAEITALEAKLQKYRHIKQGMMQNLLTGKIRLV